ncbi:hypothetical protein BOTCAL_0146g00050 [Botryotinia calthae]|uniref:Uncharacterized protein n=1 Tax=Botryotinia calthae TaxID=38488 RepID=A0A4Y8D386_9HELO|nr:hypothetical protein BOTCAL_0146g00050 [Botryotinia calthae]
MSSSSATQQPRLDRAYSTSSASSSGSNDGWLILNGHSSSTVTTPSEATDAFNPFLQLAPVTRGASTVNQKFRATENAEDRQRLFLLRARDN